MRARIGVTLVLMAALIAAIGAGAFALSRAEVSAFAVRTGSMKPSLEPGDLVLTEPVGRGQLRVGDIITFEHGRELVTHRVVRVQGDVVGTKGDANRSRDSWDTLAPQVRGRVVGEVARGGYVTVFFQQPAGVAGVMTSALALYLLWSIFFRSTAQTGSSSTRRLAPAGAT